VDSGVAALAGAAIGSTAGLLATAVTAWAGRSQATQQRMVDWAKHQREPRATAYAEFLDEALAAQNALLLMFGHLRLPPTPETEKRDKPDASLNHMQAKLARVQIEGPQTVADLALELYQVVGSQLAVIVSLMRKVEIEPKGSLRRDFIPLEELRAKADKKQAEFVSAARTALASGSLPMSNAKSE
jgi:hypothetical protein